MASAGRVVFIAGGCGFVGSGVAKAFLREGAKEKPHQENVYPIRHQFAFQSVNRALRMSGTLNVNNHMCSTDMMDSHKVADTVIVTSRSRERLETMWKNTAEKVRDRLITVQGDITSEDGINTIKEGLVSDHGQVNDVVSSLGSWWEGGVLTGQSLDTFKNEIHNLAGTHFLVAKAFLPYLSETEGSTYTFVTGQTGERCFDKKTSLGTVGGACLHGIAEAARSEFYKTKVAVNEARLGVFIMPQADSVFGFHRTRVGNDYMGEVIAAIVRGRAHELFRVSSRDDMARILRRFHANIKEYTANRPDHWME